MQPNFNMIFSHITTVNGEGSLLGGIIGYHSSFQLLWKQIDVHLLAPMH